MTAPDPADTVIEQAARRLAWAMADADGIHPGDFETDPFDDLTDDAQRDVLAFARALHDAGLLADPAGRELRVERNRWEEAAQHNFRRAERAEAEVAEVRKLGQEGLATLDRDLKNTQAEVIRLRVALRRATDTVDRVRELSDGWAEGGVGATGQEQHEIDAEVAIARELRAALDGAGEQP